MSTANLDGELLVVELNFRRGENITEALKRVPTDFRARVTPVLENVARASPGTVAALDVIGVHRILINRFKMLIEYVVRLSDGREECFPIFWAVPAVAVLPLTMSGEALLLRQWRIRPGMPGAAGVEIELPRLFTKRGESATDAAWRCLREECGAEPGPTSQLIELGSYFGAPAVLGQENTLFAITGCVEMPELRADDPTKQISIFRTRVDSLTDLAAQSADAFLSRAVLLAAHLGVFSFQH